jgi:ribulose-phosphate 3-epimerase
MRIEASLLSCDLLNLESEIEMLTEAGVDGFHIDIMDGNFVPNIAFGIDIVRQINKISRLPISVHLMVNNSLQFVDVITHPNVNYVIIHCEKIRNIETTINQIKYRGVKVGLAINPATQVSEIKDYLYLVDLALIMGVHPGYAGQTLIPSTLSKIKQIKLINKDIIAGVDGGMNDKTVTLANKEKADILVVGSYLFDNCSDDRLDCIKKKLKILCQEA